MTCSVVPHNLGRISFTSIFISDDIFSFQALNGLLRSVIEAMYVSGGEEDASSLYDRAGPHLYAQSALKTVTWMHVGLEPTQGGR